MEEAFIHMMENMGKYLMFIFLMVFLMSILKMCLDSFSSEDSKDKMEQHTEERKINLKKK